MKQLIQFVVSVLAISCLMIVSCKKNADDPSPPSIQSFSGTWVGTINVDDLNLCSWTGDPITVKQMWLVRPDSSVTINDSLLDQNATSWTETWEGRLYNKDSLCVTQTKNIDCFGVSQTITVQLKTKIIKTPDNKYTITAKVDYPVCPPVCMFAFNYLIKKQD